MTRATLTARALLPLVLLSSACAPEEETSPTQTALPNAERSSGPRGAMSWQVRALPMLASIGGCPSFSSSAVAISHAGSVLGQITVNCPSSYDSKPVIWTTSTSNPRALPLPPGTTSAWTTGLNNGFQVTGNEWINGRESGLYWNKITALPVRLGPLPGGTFTQANGVDDAKIVVGVGDVNGVQEAFTWTMNGGFTILPDLGAGAKAAGVTPGGLIVGNSTDVSGAQHVVVWSQNQIHDLGLPPGQSASARAISDNSFVVGYLIAQYAAPTLWSPGGKLTPLPLTFVYDVDEEGRAVGTIQGSWDELPYMVFPSGQLIKLPMPAGATSVQPLGMNGCAQIVGTTVSNSSSAVIWEGSCP